MTLFIRADATTRIGTGHIMRCMALAQMWQERGGQVVFLSRCESQVLQNRIIAEGFQLISIKNPYPDTSDLEQTLRALKLYAPCSEPPALSPWLTLDGYHFTQEYQRAIRDSGIRLLVIDDMNHLPYYDTDLLLNQNINAESIHYSCDPDTRLLLGTKYALLRNEFSPWQGFKREIPELARHILVTLGGGDPENVTLRTIESIKLVNMPELNVKVIAGPSNPHLDILKDVMLHAPCSMLLIQNATNMPELMAWADIAIAAGGSTCWELSFMGVPALISILAENQRGIAEGLERSSVACNLGHFSLFSVDSVAKILSDHLSDHYKRLKMSQNAMRIVDGFGREKVFDQITEMQ